MPSAPCLIERSTTYAPEARILPASPFEIASGDPAQSDHWEAYIAAHEDATLFHTLAWRDAVRDAFGHEAIYLTARCDHRVVGILPLFVVASRLAGRMLVSVPYGVGGGILADEPQVQAALFAEAKRIAADRDCPTIDLRNAGRPVPGVPMIDRYVGFQRELPSTPDEVLGWLPRKARAAARNGRGKYGLSISYGDEHLDEVWRLYTVNMRRLGSLNYPLSFFQRLIELTPDRHWVSRVRWDGRTLAGLVTFRFKDRVLPYFFGALPQAAKCSAANFIYLSAMERGVEEGCRVFDFGRTRRDNRGSFDFKRLQGFAPRPLPYQLYTAAGRDAPNLSPSNPRYRLARAAWRHLPLAFTRVVGARLSKHLPG